MDRIWLKHYETGIPSEINPEHYESINEVFRESCRKFAKRRAYTNMGTSITYEQLDKQTSAFAAFLQKQLGLKKGDRIAIMMPNCLQYPISVFAAFKAGLSVVNVNPLYTAKELKHQLRDSGATAIVIMANFAHVLEQVSDEVPVKHVVVTELGDRFSFPKSALINFVVKRIKKMVPAWHLDNITYFNNALRYGSNLSLDEVKLHSNDIAFLQYTGGTTGVAKGAVLLHRNMIANLEQASAWVKNTLTSDVSTKIITPLPLYHIFSLTANCLMFMKMGGENILITNPKDIPNFVKELKKTEFHALTGVNTLFNALLNHPEFKHIDFSKLKLTLGGGMAVQHAVAERWQQVTGCPLLEAYGLTETSPAVCINPMTLPAYNGSIGLPVPSTEVAILDDEGNELAIGETGELAVRGPQVMQGYWQRDDETAKVLSADGWFRTGDIAKIDDKGFVYIVDRKKDMIIISGFNVYPNEVEDVIAEHPGVLEVAVVGVPDDVTGEQVKAFVVKQDADLTEEDIRSFCEDKLTKYKIPKFYEFRDELPKTNVGKILRRALR